MRHACAASTPRRSSRLRRAELPPLYAAPPAATSGFAAASE